MAAVYRLQSRNTGLRTTLPIMWSRCGAGRQQPTCQRSDRQGAVSSTPWSPAGVAGNANPWRSLLHCTWNVRTFRTGAAKPNYPVRVLASTTEVPVFVRGHAAEALNFQLLWTLAIFAVWFVPLGSEGALYLGFTLVYAVVLMSGIALVLIAAKDAASAGDGKYPVRLPLFR